jgi:glycosyltransferase involved in cell wall biosynthesis
MTDNKPAESNRPSLSVIVMVKDEALNIVDCLASCEFADEVIVVDTGSRDQTVDLARQNGIQVVELPWESFGATKAKALELATSDWVLSLDADERIPPALAEEILSKMAESDVSGYELPRRSFFLGHEMRHGGWDRDWVLRLMKREQFHVTGDAVHEKIIVAGPVNRLYHPLDHHTNPTFAGYLAKIDLYSTLAAQKIAADPQRSVGLFAGVRHGTAAVIKKYLLQRGYLDGTFGALLAISTGYEKFLRYTKAGLIRKGHGDTITSTQLKVESSTRKNES